VIKVEDRRVADPPPFEEVRNQLQQQLAMELRTEYVKQLREQAEITRLYQPPPAEAAPQGTPPQGASPKAASPKETPKEGAAPKSAPPQ
jgi:peptidyl-prolyl cis-trans isomerase C